VHPIGSYRTDVSRCTLNRTLTLNLPTMTIVAQPFNVIKW